MCGHSSICYQLHFCIVILCCLLQDDRSLKTVFHRPPCPCGPSGFGSINAKHCKRLDGEAGGKEAISLLVYGFWWLLWQWQLHRVNAGSWFLWDGSVGQQCKRECFITLITILLMCSSSNSNSDRSLLSYCSISGNASSRLPAMVIIAVVPVSVAGAPVALVITLLWALHTTTFLLFFSLHG